MRTIRNTHAISYTDGITGVQAEIDVDDISELPAPDALAGTRLLQGSTAYIIHEGTIAILDGSGNWCDGNGEVIGNDVTA